MVLGHEGKRNSKDWMNDNVDQLKCSKGASNGKKSQTAACALASDAPPARVSCSSGQLGPWHSDVAACKKQMDLCMKEKGECIDCKANFAGRLRPVQPWFEGNKDHARRV